MSSGVELMTHQHHHHHFGRRRRRRRLSGCGRDKNQLLHSYLTATHSLAFI